MNYIIFDLEFNQKYSKCITEINNTKENTFFEIIQIGAIKLNNNLETIESFNSLIKPTVHTSIHPFVQKLTGITDEELLNTNFFNDVYEKFLKFIGEESAIFCVWGTSDIKELIKNIKFHNQSYSSIPKQYIDIQYIASKHFNALKGHKISLKNATELLNIDIKGEFHDAYNDAYYTAEIFKALYDINIKPLPYNDNPSKRLPNKKEIVDTIALIDQFEKMYSRQMNQNEIEMIKLAYNMGRTKQFIKKFNSYDISDSNITHKK